MKRSEINRAYRQASAFFRRCRWILPPKPNWDITDFGLGDFGRCGLTLVTLASQPEYCEKIMYSRRGQLIPCHAHKIKKEDIICRAGRLTLRLWAKKPSGKQAGKKPFLVPIDGLPRPVVPGRPVTLEAGSRITLAPGVWHAFYSASPECMIGEVSTANDDAHDNFFIDPQIGRFPEIVEDEEPAVRLVSDTR